MRASIFGSPPFPAVLAHLSLLTVNVDCNVRKTKSTRWCSRTTLQIHALKQIVTADFVNPICPVTFLSNFVFYFNFAHRVFCVPCDEGVLGNWLATRENKPSGTWLVVCWSGVLGNWWFQCLSRTAFFAAERWR